MLDLWNPVISDEVFHPNFKHLLDNDIYTKERNLIRSWSNKFVDRDGKFVKEFQSTFNSSFWELYLYQAFLALGFTHDFTNQSPDFCLNKNGKTILAEAVIANSASGEIPEWKRLNSGSPESLEEVVHTAIIRISNALDTKLRKYRNSYSLLPHVQGRPFVVCISPFEQPFFFLQNLQAIVGVLFAFDRVLTLENPDTGDICPIGKTFRPTIRKRNGSEINLGLFRTSIAEEVSAVIFSTCATVGKARAMVTEKTGRLFRSSRHNSTGLRPRVNTVNGEHYSETLLDGLNVFLNLNAKHPLSPDVFNHSEIAVHWWDKDEESWQSRMPENFLYQRRIIDLSRNLDISAFQQPGPTTDLSQELVINRYENGMEIHGYVETPNGGERYIQNHLYHFENWTIVVAFESSDGVWVCQCKEGIYFGLQSFINAGGVHHHIFTYAFPSRDEAKNEAFAFIRSL